MHRLIVALLAAVDAAIAVAVGLAATLAPLTLLWVFGLGGGADWGVLWPTGVTVWQLGNLVPLLVTLPAEYLAATGIDPSVASFTLSLAPLAFATFTAVFAARSGIRAARADAWVTGVVTSTVVYGALATAAGFTSQNLVADAELWQAILVPTLVFALPAFVAAVITEWAEAGAGAIARVRDRVEAARDGWAHVPGLIARGGAVVVVGLIGLGAAVTAVAVLASAGQIVALFQAGNVDALGATVLTLGQLAYLPTLVVWGLSFAAGPGFVVGEGGVVSPAGTQLGVLPGIPVLGAIPESTTTWLLLLALVPVALGALAGWIARSRMVGPHAETPRAPTAPAERPLPATSVVGEDADERTAALSGLLATAPIVSATDAAALVGHVGSGIGEPDRSADADHEHAEPIAARLVVTAGIAVVAAAAAAVLAACASGSLGPGALATVGPQPGPVAFAVGLEVLVGAAILLLAPHASGRTRRVGGAGAPVDTSWQGAGDGAYDVDSDTGASGEAGAGDTPRAPRAAGTAPSAPSSAETQPFEFPTIPARLLRDAGARDSEGDAPR